MTSVVVCTSCDWKRVGDDRLMLRRVALDHITETDGHLVEMQPPFAEHELPAMNFSVAEWNGQPCLAQRVRVLVPDWSEGDPPLAWWKDVAGTERAAVVVLYAGLRFILDDVDGSGWSKVTDGHGSPNRGSRSLPDRSEVVAS